MMWFIHGDFEHCGRYKSHLMNTQYETAGVNPELWKAIPASDNTGYLTKFNVWES